MKNWKSNEDGKHFQIKDKPKMMSGSSENSVSSNHTQASDLNNFSKMSNESKEKETKKVGGSYPSSYYGMVDRMENDKKIADWYDGMPASERKQFIGSNENPNIPFDKLPETTKNGLKHWHKVSERKRKGLKEYPDSVVGVNRKIDKKFPGVRIFHSTEEAKNHAEKINGQIYTFVSVDGKLYWDKGVRFVNRVSPLEYAVVSRPGHSPDNS